MILTRLNVLQLLVVVLFGFSVISCGSDDEDSPDPDPIAQATCDDGIQNGDETGVDCGGSCDACPEETVSVTRYFAGIQYGTDPTVEVLANAESITEGTITPIDNGFEQPAWMAYMQGVDQIFTVGYTSSPEYTSYEVVDGELVKGDNFFTVDDMFAGTVVDESTMLVLACPWFAFGDKYIYVVDTDNMEVVDSEITYLGDIDVDGDGDATGDGDEEDYVAMPTDMHVRGDHLFISYYLVRGDRATSNSNEALVDVFTYPGLEYVKTISDDRASNISRYYAFNGLLEAENGDIYTFSPSSAGAGYFPVPENNSAILRIKSGETEFDQDFYIDFEAASGGMKIFDMFYTTNGKAVVMAISEEETDDFSWAGYQGGGSFVTSPIISTGILDLTTGEFTLLPEVPLSGGGYQMGHTIDGSKVNLAVHSAEYQGVYTIDTDAGTATAGATIDGNMAKGLFSLTTEEVVE